MAQAMVTEYQAFARLGLNTRPDGTRPAAFGRFEAAARNDEPITQRQLNRFQRELRDLARRDHLGANGRDRAERAFQRLSRTAATV